MDNVNNRSGISLHQIPTQEQFPRVNENPEIHVQNPQNTEIDIHNQENPEIHIQNLNPEIHVQNQRNPQNPIIDIENPNPIIDIEDPHAGNNQDRAVLRRVAVACPKDFWGRWGSFIEFLKVGRVMDNQCHLKEKYGVDDEIKCIENPQAKLRPQGENVVIDIQEEGQELLSPLHVYNHNEPVRQKGHITDEKRNIVVDNPGEGLSPYTKTIYTVDDIYEHTMIDETTRTDQEDFWLDKEYKCYTIAGASLGVAIVALVTLPMIATVIVAGLAAACFALVVWRVGEATPEVYAWRDTLHEYYALRQEIGFNQRDHHDGARRLLSHYQNHKIDLIGQIFHPKEAWKFWKDEWLSYEKKLKQRLGEDGQFDDNRLDSFFKFNPYSSYDYITMKLKDKGDKHQKHSALATEYRTLKSAFEKINTNYSDQIQDLATFEKREVNKKYKYEEKIYNAYDEMMKELGNEPKAPEQNELESEEHEIWRVKKESCLNLKEHYLGLIDEGFKQRKVAFEKWHTDRKQEVENNKDILRQELLVPIQTWWDMQQDFDQDDWSLEEVKVPENIQDKHSTEPPGDLPEPAPFDQVVIKLEGLPLEESGINLDLAANFNAKIK